jgi:hypothetical protein
MTAIFTAAPYFVARFSLLVIRQSSVVNAHRKFKPHFSANGAVLSARRQRRSRDTSRKPIVCLEVLPFATSNCARSARRRAWRRLSRQPQVRENALDQRRLFYRSDDLERERGQFTTLPKE